MLTEEDNRKNKKTPLLRKDPVFHKNETKIGDQKFSYQSRLNYDYKEFIPYKKYFPDDVSQSSNHDLNKNYQYNGKVSKMPCKLIQQQTAPEKTKFMAPFYGWGSSASRLEPLRGSGVLFTTKFPEISGTHFINLRRIKG